MRSLSAHFIATLLVLVSMISASKAYSCKIFTPRSACSAFTGDLIRSSGSTAAAIMDAALGAVSTRSMDHHQHLSVLDALDEIFDSAMLYPQGKQATRYRSSPAHIEEQPSGTGYSSDVASATTASSPARMLTLHVDIRASSTAYEIVADLPGVDKGDIQVDVKNEVLNVSAERKTAPLSDGEKYHRNERLAGIAKRTFSLPEDADKDNISAKYVNGVLTLTVPRIPAAPAPEKKSIYIN